MACIGAEDSNSRVILMKDFWNGQENDYWLFFQ